VKRAAITLLLTLALAPFAAAHRGLHVEGYTSTLAGLEPNVLGVLVNVVGGDDRLRLSNYSRKTVLVFGYRGEPYLRFTKNGVYENFRSPNAYLDRYRYPPDEAPPGADATAAPQWTKVADGQTFEWHDHRIHWPRREPPPAVQNDPDRVHLIKNWSVPARAGGTRFAIKGFLGYTPTPKSDDGDDWLVPALAGAGAAAVAATAGMLWARRARRRAH
jgi:hypothetical protein